MNSDIEQILITESELQAKIKELGSRIAEDYKDKIPVLIGVLNGAVMFVSDLIRACPIQLNIDFMAVSSYQDSTESSGVVKIIKDLDRNISGRHILIVEDIIDTGLTLSYLLETLQARHPASIKVCALLDKASRRRVNVPIDYLGFQIPDKFVVGYGLDFRDLYRNLPYIGVLKPYLYEGITGDNDI
ncbi:hypoxanthine phosphoribosyltransferase [Thermobaculum terrenum ATCC BAA-798]|uniref:Hypoxanthine phosphoribosyltransferase n=1 Tax=Thermobaculum terrenum (strain ATCC BAA-798 / CCMEE 7001 / YNP1) TaxID=525904 RepID=D1CDF0_THET1|nr:hypoxanthine phosphoribosyltransferase [Thermobaculum terrenum]ACZ40956.1 hypoxanthine phosphoribosyltransferase [Thermobaculum terrenum ATCC BAA-798]